MPLGIDPKVDYAFKLVFGSPDHTAVTIHFLNAVLELPQPISWVEILNPIHGQDFSDDKLSVLDVLARDAEGRRYNIEMQTTLPAELVKRITYYNCGNYIRQLKSGEPYGQLRPAISICVLNGVLFPSVPEHHLSFCLRCDQHPECCSIPIWRSICWNCPSTMRLTIIGNSGTHWKSGSTSSRTRKTSKRKQLPAS